MIPSAGSTIPLILLNVHSDWAFEQWGRILLQKSFLCLKQSHKLYTPTFIFMVSSNNKETFQPNASCRDPILPAALALEETGSLHRRGPYLCQLLPG